MAHLPKIAVILFAVVFFTVSGAAQAPWKIIRVVEATKGGPEAGLGDEIAITVQPFQPILDKANCVQPTSSSCIKQDIILFLDGRPLPCVNAERPNPTDSTMRFRLRRTDELKPTCNTDNKNSWDALLGSPDAFIRPVSLGVGLEKNGFPDAVLRDEKDHEAKFDLIVIRSAWFWVCAGALIVTLVLFFWLARDSNIIRDPGPPPPGDAVRAYSLARTQMAFWFFLVISSFLLIWIITGQLDTITDSALALIGIGSGTALGAAVVDASKRQSAATQLQSLQAERGTLNARVNTLQTLTTAAPPPANLVDLQQELHEKQQRLNDVNNSINNLAAASSAVPSSGFLNDLLKDGSGISFHRFQMFVWTLLLGIIFCISVYTHLAMPTFSGTLLGLMGISSGTYIGFKFPEQQS
jgi:hypothetical protein